MLNKPMTAGIMVIPPIMYVLPKVKRALPITGSIPMQAIRRPIQPIMSPLMMLLVEREAIIVRPNAAIKKRSCAPKLNAHLAMTGAKKSRARLPTIPPQKDDTADSTNASCARPYFVISKPSIAVAAAAAVPGVLIRIAEIDPPNIEPQ